MKKAISFLSIILLLALGFTNPAVAGKKEFQGIITYKITYPDTDLDAQTMSMMPRVSTVMIKENMMKSSLTMGMGTQSSIVNGNDNTSITLIDMMGQKYALRSSTEENMKEMEKYETSVDITGDTKEIAGFDCKQAIINMKNKETGDENKLTVYFTDKYDIGNIYADQPMFKGIDGILLQYEIDARGMKMVLTATDVKKKKISDDEFKIPEGFTETTREELQRNFGG